MSLRRDTVSSVRRLIILVGLLAQGIAFGQTVDDATITDLTAEVLESRIDQLQESSAYNETTRSTTLEYYQRALANLGSTAAYDEATERFRQSITEAPVEAERVRAAIAERKDTDPLDGMTVSGDSAATEIEEQVQRERGSEAAARALLTELRQKLSTEGTGPQAARERIGTATEELRGLNERMLQPDNPDDPAVVLEARRIARQTTDTMLRAEIRMLDQEILSQPVRIVLLQAQSDEAALVLDRQQARIRVLQAMLSERRRDETDRVLADLGLETLGAEVAHPLIEQTMSEVRELADELDELTATVEALSQSNQVAELQLEELRQRFERARSRLEVAGIGQALGRYLAQERRELQASSDYRRESSLREDQIAEASIRNINLVERARTTRNVESHVDGQLAQVADEQAQLLRPALVQVVESKNSLQQQLIGLYGSYLRLLTDSGYTQSQLFEVSSEYRDFLAEHLMWVRSRGPFGRADIVALPGELMEFLEPGRWIETAGIFANRLLRSPLLIAALLVLLLMYWKKASLRARLHGTAAKVNKPSEDSFGSTLKAVALTILVTLPWPVFVAVAGYEISNAPGASDGARAIGMGLLRLTPMYLILRVFRMLCTRGGVAESHFRWALEGVAILRRQFDLLTPILILPAFVIFVNRQVHETAPASGLHQILMLLLAGVLTVFFYRLLRPKTGIAKRLQRRLSGKPMVRFPGLSIGLATLIPLAVGVMALAGFMYSAGLLIMKMLYSVLLLFVFVIIRELIVRWLLVVKRRLLLQEALQRREAAAREATGDASPSDESPESVENAVEDIASLDADTRKLINVALIIGLILGITGIWSSVLPALGVFADITLWQYVATVGGEETLKAVTLIDLFAAVMVIVITVVSARNIPSLIEIVLRQWPSVKAGSRLAFSTLARYTIGAAGIFATLSILGLNWAKLQWLVAALGVGIGFGLQEIVANFISGLIILIERPVRVGDIVTVGDMSGTVTRIQIRATTLRTWDRQELLVPNKEFIASRVLNWSLSDDVVRLVLAVGVAYGSDVERALRLIEEAAIEHPDVLVDPPPLVTFESFGDNSLNLGLRCFVQDLDIRLETMTDLYRAINRKFNDAGIVIAFPQRDLHLDTASPLEVRILQGVSPKP